jgi:hypothetical protein
MPKKKKHENNLFFLLVMKVKSEIKNLKMKWFWRFLIAKNEGLK